MKTSFKCKPTGLKEVAPELRSQTVSQVKEIHRHQLYSEFFILNRKDYEGCKDKDLTFDLSYLDPYKRAMVTIEVNKNDFLQIEDGSTLAKMAAHYKIR